jgi:hypothetical protein
MSTAILHPIQTYLSTSLFHKALLELRVLKVFKALTVFKALKERKAQRAHKVL